MHCSPSVRPTCQIRHVPSVWLIILTLTGCPASAAAPLTATAAGLAVTNAERSEVQRWTAAKFEGAAESKPASGYLQILDKEGTVRKNAGPGGFINIANETYRRGLYTGKVGKVAVHLPARAKSFEAVVGLDVNYLGSDFEGNGPSVFSTFSVRAGDKLAFEGNAVKLGDSGMAVKVDLAGETDFVLGSDGAEGRQPCPQGVWADARVTLEDGSILWLDELPVAPTHGPYKTEPQFSFTYGGRPSVELLKSWAIQRQLRQLDDRRTEYTVTYRDPQTGLVLRSVGVEYRDYPTVEWTLYFENTGSVDTPILENIQALDTRLERNGDGEFILHHSKGSLMTPTDYEPYETTLVAKQAKRITTSGGRPTNSDLCYFNLEWSGEGVIVALGWPGQWAAEFTRDAERGLRVQAGQELTHFKLHPGEKVRTPLVVLQFWKGDWIRAQNIWRRWMLAHNTPREGGKPLGPAAWAENTDSLGYVGVDEANQELAISQYLEHGLRPDYWEMDAGWYVNNGGWWNTGTWEPDPKRFPHGLRPLCDYAHAHGLKTHIWFEPERVTRGSWLWEKHPEWLLQYPEGERDGLRLLNLGHPQAYQWVVDTMDNYINDGIDFYRTDFNIAPLPYWRANDAPDRQGITEIKYATAFLAYFDELLRRHPNLLIDTCASGGRRNDLETLRRAVPITRSDYGLEPLGDQNITYGMALWIPIYGGGTLSSNPYTIRSSWVPRFGFAWDVRRKDLDYDFLRHMLGDWRSVADYFFGDYYPLTPYNSTNNAWMAWQFDRPDLGAGMVQVFRRPESPYESALFRLNGLDPAAEYEIKNFDEPGVTKSTGRELMEDGLHVAIPKAPTALIFTYRIKPEK